MRVLGCDLYLSAENAIRLGIEKVDFDELLSRADFITFHTPLKDSIRNIISSDALNKTKKGVRIINCARGGLADELALAAALVEVDGALPAGVLDEIKSLPQVVRADRLQFSAQD